MTNSKQQMAVDFLVEKMLTQDWYTYKSLEYINQSKEIEKEKMIDFACLCMFGDKNVGINLRNDFVRKYNEIYGGGE
jgi:hypothetical protein